ncbi:hypothetical protein N8H22_19265 [Stutzerimonas stutzeri]|nr:PA1414 family protein [Stutzerimonas sp. S1]MCW3150750.1 hypothetical protein [Stutzerimonas sp. S1]
MKARLNYVMWRLAVALGLIEAPRMQPIRVPTERTDASRPRRR